MKLINGRVYSRGRFVFVLIYNNGKYSMLHIERHRIRGLSCPMFYTGENQQIFYTEKELREKFDLDSWEMLDGRLRIEKIDDMSLIEHTNGVLEIINKEQ